MWGATTDASAVIATINISIHAPRVGRDERTKDDFGRVVISIHAPRVGRDKRKNDGNWRGEYFCTEYTAGISIHAPRVGRDD